MQWKQVGKFAAMMFAASLASNAMAAGALPEKERAPTIATMEETRVILRAVLEAIPYQDESPEPPEPSETPRAEPAPKTLLLVDTSLCLGNEASRKCDSHLGHWPDNMDAFAPRALLDDLMRANATTASLDLSGIAGTAMIREEDVSAPFTLDWWSQFRARFPDTSGYMRITRPVLDDARKVAVIYVAHQCGGLCGTGTLVRLERTARGWRVAMIQGVWVS